MAISFFSKKSVRFSGFGTLSTEANQSHMHDIQDIFENTAGKFPADAAVKPFLIARISKK